MGGGCAAAAAHHTDVVLGDELGHLRAIAEMSEGVLVRPRCIGSAVVGEDRESRVGCDGAERRDREATTAKKDQATTCDYALATPYGAVRRQPLLVNRLAPHRHLRQRR